MYLCGQLIEYASSHHLKSYLCMYVRTCTVVDSVVPLMDLKVTFHLKWKRNISYFHNVYCGSLASCPLPAPVGASGV